MAAPREVDWGAGAALLYRVAAAAGRPAFDDRFFLYFEDVDLCANLWRRGFTVMHYPALIFRHDVQRQSSSSLRFLGYHLASLIKFIWKYQGLPSRGDLVRRGS
jgi:GT2 family glycosyltransferase